VSLSGIRHIFHTGTPTLLCEPPCLGFGCTPCTLHIHIYGLTAPLYATVTLYVYCAYQLKRGGCGVWWCVCVCGGACVCVCLPCLCVCACLYDCIPQLACTLYVLLTASSMQVCSNLQHCTRVRFCVACFVFYPLVCFYSYCIPLCVYFFFYFVKNKIST